MYLLQLKSTFTNYLKVHCPFEWSPLSESQKPEIKQSHTYSLNADVVYTEMPNHEQTN